MDYETIVFDTAPTGHTLRLLNFPNLLDKGLARILALKEKFTTIMNSVKNENDLINFFVKSLQDF